MKRKDTAAVILSIAGIGAGIMAGYLRSFSPMSFWSVSDIAGRYGFWILTVSLIAFFSESAKKAGLHGFLYMAFMCAAYYGYLYLVKDLLYVKQFIFWIIFAVIASAYSVLLRIAKGKQRKRDIAVCVIPISLIGIEFMDVLYNFLHYQTNFLQLLIDFIGVIVLSFLFSKGKLKKSRFAILGISFLIIIAVCLTFLILWSV